MSGMGFEQIQNISQLQTQRMSQQQIQSMKMLGMNAFDLRTEIYKEVERNPALEIKNDPLVSGVSGVKKVSSSPSDYTRLGNASAAGEEASENFQQMLENTVDARESLQDHLISQLNIMHVSSAERSIGERLIYNLDQYGHHILAPISLLDKKNPEDTRLLLEKMIKTVQHFDPIGTCCTNIEESLLIQAQAKKDIGEDFPESMDFFILSGHLDFLDPPVPMKIKRKIEKFITSYSKLDFTPSSAEGEEQKEKYLEELSKSEIKLSDVEKSLRFIKTLNPYPAAAYDTSHVPYIAPDVYVKKVPVSMDDGEESPDLIRSDAGYSFRVIFSRNNLPDIEISPEFLNYDQSDKVRAKPGQKSAKSEKKFISSSLKAAKNFISNLQFRENTIVSASCQIVKQQIEFFKKGPRYLVPLREKDIAEIIGVHESTVSRMANSKYIQCDWGLFPVKFFFSNSIEKPSESGSPARDPEKSDKSKEAVKYEIAEILTEHASDKKRLSDQKISEILAERNIRIARRTVAKYRHELNIASSFDR